MSSKQLKTGTIKWYRSDYTGYVVEDGYPNVSYYFDGSILNCAPMEQWTLVHGTPIRFTLTTVLGTVVCAQVETIGE